MNEWQSIETAPKDSSEVVVIGPIFYHYDKEGGQVWSERPYSCITSYLDEGGERRPKYGGFDKDEWEFLAPGLSTTIRPTHWMSLPDPPVEQPRVDQ